jgi:excisionase family DNA binding protein
MTPQLPDKVALTVEETATALGTGRSATYEAVRRGQLPSIRVGRRVLVPTAALRRLLAIDADE